MKKNKHQKDFDKVEEFKERFSKETTEQLKQRLNSYLVKGPGSAAIRQILRDRGESL